MAFPTTPTNGQQYTVNGTTYQWNNSNGTWDKVGTTTGNLTAIFNGNSNVRVAANSNVTVSVAGNANVLTITGTGVNIAGTVSLTNNLTFSGTGLRLLGDFSNATIANRLMFQSSTANGSTSIGVLPNGTSTITNINLFGGTDSTNASIAQMVNTGSEASFRGAITGTGTYLPLTFYTGGSERVRIDTNGNVGIGNTSPAHALSITGNVNAVYTPASATGAAVQLTGKDTQGGTGWFDFLRATNTTSGATNPNKSFRLNSTGGIEVINSAYSATILSLSDTGGLSVPGPISISGKKAVNGPAFSAYANATLQTITSGSQQKVLFQTEEFDTDSCFDSSRFTPNVEGYYQLNAEVRLDGSSGTGEIMIVLYKNTSEHKRGTNQSGTSIATSFWAMQVSSLVYANGTTDYFEIRVQQTSGANVTVTAVNNPAITWFNGAMVRGA